MSEHPDEDGDLLLRIARGDDQAFAVFYRAHLDAVLAFFRRRLCDAELAFDLTAETFAAVAVGASSWQQDAPPVAWLYGIARNKLRESLRAGKVEEAARRKLGMERVALQDGDIERVEERAASGHAALEHELAALPAPMREALLARLVEELEYEQIAERMGCSEQLVRQRVHRGLTRLRAALKVQR
ncbi:MAG TPA: RNA polymerase sigma factor [Solirubrobacteraceae bacterium]|nr:RNA polymerase sigma factor [Solirubrobacteraceae bacterium]